jgi:hypothetical protein
MGKKKQDTIQDIMDRIQEEIDLLRDKVNDLENNQCEIPPQINHLIYLF